MLDFPAPCASGSGGHGGERFDRITRLARRVFDVPIALVSLVDAERLSFKSHQGIDLRETPREVSFCAHAIHDDRVFTSPTRSPTRASRTTPR